jgi:hypothetical protein
MTMQRTEYLKSTLIRWLDRYSPPASMRGNAQAIQDEVTGLLRILLKFAPPSAYEDWVAEALERCSQIMKTRAYPTQNELGSACRNYNKDRHDAGEADAGPVSEWKPDPALFISNKMARGEPVGEGWLYGIMACELIARKLVGRETMDTYRSGAYLARKSFYGEDAARAWENDAKDRHDAAKVLWRTRNDVKKKRGNYDIRELVAWDASDEVVF